MSRSDILWRCVIVFVSLAVAVGGSLLSGQSDLVLLFGTILGALILAGILGFVSYGAPFTLLAALLLAPLAVSRFVPGFGSVLASWFLSIWSGWTIGAMLRSEWDRRRGCVAPNSKALKNHDGDSLEWRVERKAFREAGYSEAALVAKIRSLDGDRRTLVSATRGEACLTVAGNAQGALVVCFSPETSKEDQWSMLTSPGSDPGQVDVKIGPMVISHASWETTTLEKALVAAHYFHLKGRADPQLTWFSSPTIADWRTLSA